MATENPPPIRLVSRNAWSDDMLTPELEELVEQANARVAEPPSTEATTHSLKRTSPLGEAFVGRCTLCGDVDLPMVAATWPCINPRGVSQDDALLAAIEGRDP